MIVQIEFTVPVGVVVDTETGAVTSVHVWDTDLDTGAPVAAFDDGADHASLALDHPEAAKALATLRDENVMWPAWQFDA